MTQAPISDFLIRVQGCICEIPDRRAAFLEGLQIDIAQTKESRKQARVAGNDVDFATLTAALKVMQEAHDQLQRLQDEDAPVKRRRVASDSDSESMKF